MAGIQDFLGMATQKLGLDASAAKAGTGGLLGLIQQHAGGDFGKLAAAIPGAADLLKAGAGGGAGGGMGGMLGGLAQKAGGMLGGAGGAAGALAALAGAGLTGDKAGSFLKMFLDFLKSKLPGDLFASILSKVPGLGR